MFYQISMHSKLYHNIDRLKKYIKGEITDKPLILPLWKDNYSWPRMSKDEKHRLLPPYKSQLIQNP